MDDYRINKGIEKLNGLRDGGKTEAPRVYYRFIRTVADNRFSASGIAAKGRKPINIMKFISDKGFRRKFDSCWVYHCLEKET